ncbi:hypothetical protein BH09PSE4_BH09PSE4_09190 [soil metagenome]
MTQRTFLTNEAPHPFRQSLIEARALRVPSDDQDLKLFVLAYTAFFVCFYAFIF